MYPFNFKRGQRIQTNARGVAADRGFIAHVQVAAADAVALDADGVLGATNLGAAAQSITAGITDPAVPRGLSIVGNVSGITGNVVIAGTDYAAEAIAETLVLNGATPRLGARAFRSITKIDLPVQSHTPTAQVETVTVTAGATTAGDITVRVTAAGLAGSPLDTVVAVAEGDTTAQVAGKVRTALGGVAAITALFAVSGATADVILTRLVPAANDATLAIALQAAGGTGVTFGSSIDTTAGVPYDIITVGWSDILGLPYLLAHNTVLAAYLNNVKEGTAPTVTVSATVLESNTVKLDSALNGSVLDVYLIV